MIYNYKIKLSFQSNIYNYNEQT